MDLKNNIKVFGAFKKFVDILYGIISALRIFAVAILVLQAIFLICENGKSFSSVFSKL